MSQATSEFDDLLYRAKDGDQAARGDLLDSFRRYLMALTLHYLDPRLATRLDASDVVQQTCVTALASFEQFRGAHQGEFAQWLKVVHEHVMQNLAREHVRTQKRSVKRELRVSDSWWGAWGGKSDRSSPSQKLMNVEMAVRIAIALEALPEDQREAVRLRYFENSSLEKMADAMNRSKPAVAALLKRGMIALRKSFG